MKNNFSDLVTFDDYRLTQLFEIIQYSVLYIVICLITGIYLDYLFPDLNKNKSTLNILLELSFQSVIVALAVFYIRKVTKVIPLMITASGYNSDSHDYSGEVVIAIVFFTTQKKILDKINILHDRFLSGLN